MNTQRIQKLITFSPKLYELLEKKAQKIGVSFPEYIRGLAVNDIKKSIEYIPFITQEEEEGIRKSLQDIDKGRFVVLEKDKDIDEHFKNLQ